MFCIDVCDYMQAHEEDYQLFVVSDDCEEPKDAFERHRTYRLCDGLIA